MSDAADQKNEASLMEIGERLRMERKRLGYSIAAFAEGCDVHKISIMNYEAGKRSANINMLLAFQQAGVDIGYLLSGRRQIEELDAQQTLLLDSFAKLSAAEQQAILALTDQLSNKTEAAPPNTAGTDATVHEPRDDFRQK